MNRATAHPPSQDSGKLSPHARMPEWNAKGYRFHPRRSNAVRRRARVRKTGVNSRVLRVKLWFRSNWFRTIRSTRLTRPNPANTHMSTTRKRTDRRLDQAGLDDPEVGVVFSGPLDGPQVLPVGDSITVVYQVLCDPRL